MQDLAEASGTTTTRIAPVSLREDVPSAKASIYLHMNVETEQLAGPFTKLPASKTKQRLVLRHVPPKQDAEAYRALAPWRTEALTCCAWAKGEPFFPNALGKEADFVTRMQHFVKGIMSPSALHAEQVLGERDLDTTENLWAMALYALDEQDLAKGMAVLIDELEAGRLLPRVTLFYSSSFSFDPKKPRSSIRAIRAPLRLYCTIVCGSIKRKHCLI